jgi:hypothetical protein
MGRDVMDISGPDVDNRDIPALSNLITVEYRDENILFPEMSGVFPARAS